MLTIPGISVISQIYESNNSLVYRGIREQDSQPLILKILKQDYPSPAELTRYRTEYQITRSLDFTGVVKVYDLQKYQNTLVMLLEDFQGESLNVWMQQQQFNLEEFLQIAIATTETLGQIHAAHIIHKDINPSNIIFNAKNGQLKIIDFGISTKLSRENPTLKNPNLLEGTLAYMSPEQTGRMNRCLDYRTDFYSLGATFYELLTGQLPFDTTDALQLVHCHIAKQPLSPSEVNPNIPQVVSDIVIKLLAKTAEERYQNAFGIKTDLERCLEQLRSNGIITNFSIASQDISDRFQIPQKLYGREREINILITAFERVSNPLHKGELSRSEMMLIAGYSGIGKSALVQEIYKPITEKQGYFISGKFDQYQRNIPYSAVINALGQLVKQLLTESTAQLKQWREKIIEAVGVNGQAIADVIPEVELIIGHQPALAELSPTEAQNRFNLVFQNFIKVFTHPSHPLVIFLDDLQWADGASLKLMQLLMSAASPGLFLIGAYRVNEVSAAHPLMLTIDEIEKIGAVVNQIHLSPLDLPVVTHLISDTLNCSPEKAEPLAELVLLKTDGNPFFMNEFLRSLYTEKLLSFNFNSLNGRENIGEWHWDLEQIKAQGFTDNVVELMAGKIQKLPENTQQILKIAACIGNQFELETIALTTERSLQETVSDLYVAVAENLVLPPGSIKDLEIEVNQKNSHRQFLEYKFVHDRIQQAAYTLLAEKDKQTIHQQIGKLLLQNTPLERREEKIFDIVNHLNFATELVTNPTEIEELIQLNFIAGKKAKATAAYEPACNYLEISINLLGESGWQHHYSQTLALHQEAAEAAYLSGNFERLEKLTEIVLNKAQTVLDKVPVIEAKILALNAESKLEQSIKTGVEFLRELGVKLPSNPHNFDVLMGLLKTKLALAGKQIAKLGDLPPMSDPEKKATVNILTKIIAPAYFAAPKLVALIICQQVILSVKYGSTPNSIHSYAMYGMLLCGVVGDIDSGYAFGELALSLLERFNAREFKAKALVLMHCFIQHWKKPARESLLTFIDAYKTALETGDLEFAGYAANSYCYMSFLIGSELSALELQIPAYCEAMQQIKQEQNLVPLQLYLQTIINLSGSVENPCSLSGDIYDEKTRLPFHIQKKQGSSIFFLSLNKLILCYLFGQYAEAVASKAYAEKYLDSASGFLCSTYLFFYGSLAQLALYPSIAKPEQKRCLAQVAANQRKIKKWATYSPINHQHKYYLVEAERCRVLGKDIIAMDYYERAINLAKQHEFVNEAALAYELAAKFYLEKGKELSAKAYMQEARYCYQIWGAITKVKDLESRYPQLLQRKYAPYKIDAKATQSSLALTAADYSSSLDLTSVMKASQTLSSEIVLEKLLAALMKILIENAGAQKGFLILPQKGKLVIAASIAGDAEKVIVQQFTPVESSKDLPLTVINYVERTNTDVVLTNAAIEGNFISDPYVALNNLKSVLCTPILNQGKLIAILYLENNLTIGAFTADRLEVLRMLSSQAAISLENALLYASLEQKVQDRTQQLKEKNIHLEETLHQLKYTQAQLIQAEKMSGLGQMVAGIAHEINNPVNFIFGNLSYADNYLQDLLNLIHTYQEEYPNPTEKIQEVTEDIDLEFLVTDLKKLLNSMKEGATRISNIVLGLRTFSRLDESEKKAVDINEGIESTLLVLQHRFNAKNGRAKIEIIQNFGKLPLVNCYASQLNQVFMNILNNAVDAIEERLADPILKENNGSFIPTIRISTDLTATHIIQIRIADNGIGITEEILPNIFNPFFTTKPVGSGTGLGLSVSYQIVVDAHGGQLNCVSTRHQGTEFIIEIPSNN